MSRPGGSRESGSYGLNCEINGKPVILRAEDLTTAGFFIETTSPYALDREVAITVRSTVGELVARGQVVQVVDRERARQQGRRPGFGVLFMSLEDDQRAFIGLTLDAITRAQAAAARPQPSPPPPQAVSARPQQPPAPSVQPPKAASSARPKAAAAPPGPSAEQKQVAAELRAELTKLQGKTAWTALGLEADSPLEGAKEAFLRLSKRFHPHKFARHNSPEISKLATEVFIAYKRSYSVLTKLAPRAPTAALQDTRAARRTLTSIAPTANTSVRPAASPRPAGNRTRTR